MQAELTKTKTVKLETVLFEFIEPIVLLYKSGRSYCIASALPSDAGFVEEYLLVTVLPKYLKRYFRQECDLRYLFVTAPARRFFKLPASKLPAKSVKVEEFTGAISEDMLPEPQFFASSHTHSYSEFDRRYSALETLRIDGNWEMEDFGIFSSRYRDLYAFEESLNKLETPNTPEKQREKISNAFRGNTLTGGGSYVNLFRDLLNVLPRDERYDLKQVQYASPGKVVLQGKGEVFDTLEGRIRNFLENGQEIHDKYIALYTFMSESKLLDISNPTTRISEPVAKRIKTEASELFLALGMNLFDTVYVLNEGNVPNTAKVALAVYRRFRSASLYFAEGRITYDNS